MQVRFHFIEALKPHTPPASWFWINGEQLLLAVYAQPGAKRTEVQGLHGDALKIRVAAPPLEGRANDEIRRFLADILAVPLRDVELVSGDKSRSKRFSIRRGRVDPLRELVGTLA